MKVTKTSTQPAFQPIELKITIERQEEYDLFFMLCSNDHTVCKAIAGVEDISSDEEDLLQEMLAGIYRSL